MIIMELAGKNAFKQISHRPFLFIKGQLVYSYDYNKIAFTNCIGKVTRTIDIGNYQFHHDFRYDKKHDKIILSGK